MFTLFLSPMEAPCIYTPLRKTLNIYSALSAARLLFFSGQRDKNIQLKVKHCSCLSLSLFTQSPNLSGEEAGQIPQRSTVTSLNNNNGKKLIHTLRRVFPLSLSVSTFPSSRSSTLPFAEIFISADILNYKSHTQPKSLS